MIDMPYAFEMIVTLAKCEHEGIWVGVFLYLLGFHSCVSL